MANCAIVGINWGDEGKGRMVDYLAGKYDVVVRYQGGNNAGHTVINEYGKFALNLLPSGVFHPKAVNLLGSSVRPDHTSPSRVNINSALHQCMPCVRTLE